MRSTLFTPQPFHLFRFYFLVVSWKAVTNNPPGLFKYLPEFLSLLSIFPISYGPYLRVQTSPPWYNPLTVHTTASITVQLLASPWVRGAPHFTYVYPPHNETHLVGQRHKTTRVK